MNYACAAAIGAVTGLRSMTGPAVVATAARDDMVNLERTPLRRLAGRKAARIASALAIGEMIADKMPFIPDRVKPAPLAFRAAAGALCGYAVFAAHGKREAIAGAAIGASTAIAAAWAGYEYRRHTPVPGLVSALLEDAVAAGIAAVILQNLCARDRAYNTHSEE